jgi:hypothetical protein
MQPVNQQENMNTENEARIKALAAYLECEPEEIGEEKWDCYGMPIFSHGNAEYAVGTDEEADAAWDGELDNYIEECIEPEIEKITLAGNLASYVTFDSDAWKRDARMDGRGHALSRYDGDEIELDGGFYAFRLN